MTRAALLLLFSALPILAYVPDPFDGTPNHRTDFANIQFLVNQADTGHNCLGRSPKGHGLPIESHLASIGLVHPGNDLHEGGFSRPVLTHNGKDFPRLK